MSSIDQEFVEFVVKSLVGAPEAVSIERRIDEKGVLLELTVDPEDLGRVIGKRGATAQSIRTLLRALGTKNDARYNLKIIDVGEGYEKPERADNPAADNVYGENDDTTSASDDQSPVSPSPDDDLSSNEDEDEVPEVLETPEEPETKPAERDISSRTRDELAELDDLDI